MKCMMCPLSPYGTLSHVACASGMWDNYAIVTVAICSPCVADPIGLPLDLCNAIMRGTDEVESKHSQICKLQKGNNTGTELTDLVYAQHDYDQNHKKECMLFGVQPYACNDPWLLRSIKALSQFHCHGDPYPTLHVELLKEAQVYAFGFQRPPPVAPIEGMHC